LHLVKSYLAQQVVSAGIPGVALEHLFRLPAGVGILSRRDEEIAEVQPGIQILGSEFDSAREGLFGGRGMLLLDLQQSQAIVRISEIRVDLKGLTVFVFRWGKLFLREILVSGFDMRLGARGAAAGWKKPENRYQQEKNDRSARKRSASHWD
jgi:hypothetical protein